MCVWLGHLSRFGHEALFNIRHLPPPRPAFSPKALRPSLTPTSRSFTHASRPSPSQINLSSRRIDLLNTLFRLQNLI